MSYPEPVYSGATGEASATHRPNEQAPDLEYPDSGTRVQYLATGATTGGKFGLYRWDMGPDRSGPGPHFHRSVAESFYILSGTVKIYNGTEWIDAYPGDFIYVPEGGIHGFRNESAAPASMLLLFSPGAPREGYFEGLLRLPEMSDDEKSEFYAEHDNVWI